MLFFSYMCRSYQSAYWIFTMGIVICSLYLLKIVAYFSTDKDWSELLFAHLS